MPKNRACAAGLARRGLRGVEAAQHVELGGRREVEQGLELGHEMDLAAAVERVDALLGGRDRVAVEIGGPLLELGEVLDRFQGPLRAEQPLDVHAAEAGRVDAVAELLRADVADQVRGRVGVAVDMAVETDHATMGGQRAAVQRLVELLLRERRDQQPQPFELFGVQDAAEQLVEVGDRDELALRHVAQVGPRGQEDGRRKLGQQVGRQVEVEVESRQVAGLLLLDLVDVVLRKQHAPFGMVRVRQR